MGTTQNIAARPVTVKTVATEVQNTLNSGAVKTTISQEITVTGAVNAGVNAVELNHATVIAAATLADAAQYQGLFCVKNTSASGTAAHTLTLTSGTFDGTNNIATLDAPDEQLLVFFDSNGKGIVIENTGTVGLST